MYKLNTIITKIINKEEFSENRTHIDLSLQTSPPQQRKDMIRLNSMAIGYEINYSTSWSEKYIPCIKAKHTRRPFPQHEYTLSFPLRLVYTDLCGPMETSSIGNNKYFLTFIEDHIRYTIVYILKYKN